MFDKENIDLSKLLPDSVDLHANTFTQCRRSTPIVNNPFLEFLNQGPMEILGDKSFVKLKDIPEDVVGSPIQEFYRGTNVFVTGGTGFLGKTLIQKLIRSIPHLGQIYVLIRPKRGKGPQERFQTLLEDKLFNRMKEEVPEYLSKITALSGDLLQPSLGLSPADRQLLITKVHVVINGAADVRFGDPLRKAVESNTLGSQRVMELAKEMENLKSFVHVSTAFSQCVHRVISEVVPKMSISYKEILQEIECKSDEELERDIDRIMQGWPNTYVFSKALCEEMLTEEAKDLPLCILRPSVILPTYLDPVRGWSDNLYGPLGMLLGWMLGIIHCCEIDIEGTLDVVPVDYTANIAIVAAWASACRRTSSNTSVYNFVSTPLWRFTWKDLRSKGEGIMDSFPYANSVWYPSCFYTRSHAVDEIGHFFLHKIPGIVLDKIAGLNGQEPRLSKIYERMHRLKKYTHYFTYKSWEYKNENSMELWQRLTTEDKKEFCFDLRNIDWFEYIVICKLGMRYYILKEGMDTIADSEQKYKRLYWAHFALKAISSAVVLKLLVIAARFLPI